MKISIDVPPYSNDEGLDVIWESDGDFNIVISENEITLEANEKALLALGTQMIYLATQNVPNGSHVHYDDSFCKNLTSKIGLCISKNNLLPSSLQTKEQV